MSQTIKPVKWLESALWLLGVWTGVVMNDEGGELWTCSLAFDIPIRYNTKMCQDIVQTGRQMSTKSGI